MRLFALASAFFCGSLPFAFWMGLLKGVDIRKHGSGNPGATNAFRVLGKQWGILCLILDALKGALPVMIFSQQSPGSSGWQWVLGLAAILGHIFSPFLKFKGGKGVATSLGVLLAIEPVAMVAAAVAGALVIFATGYVSLASIVGAALAPVVLLLYPLEGSRHWISICVTVLLAFMIVVRHRANIGRLRAGTEPKLFDRNKK